MRPRKYPLEPLVRLRKERADSSVRVLAKAIDAREDAEQKRLAAEKQRAEGEERARVVRETEARALVRGELRAADLQRQGAWHARVTWEDEEAQRRVAELALKEAGLREGEGRARAGVASREAEVDVVDEHRARWDGETTKRDSAAEEEGAAEAWRPRKG